MNAAAARKRAQSGLQRQLSVLVADDDRDTVDTLAAILGDEGHVVHTVVDGRLVMDAVQRHRPDVCILDIEMPGQSGYAIAREIVEWGGRNMPWLIAISGRWTAKSDQLLAHSVGFDHFLKKPAEPKDILDLLDALPDDDPAAT